MNEQGVKAGVLAVMDDSAQELMRLACPAKARRMCEARADVAEVIKALKESRRELQACQAAIHLAGGFDPAYVTGAQASLRRTDAALARCQPATRPQGE